MKKLIQIVTGRTFIACGAGLLLFGSWLFLRELSWATIIAFIFIFGFGFALINLGYAILTGGNVKDALIFLFFLGNRTRN